MSHLGTFEIRPPNFCAGTIWTIESCPSSLSSKSLRINPIKQFTVNWHRKPSLLSMPAKVLNCSIDMTLKWKMILSKWGYKRLVATKHKYVALLESKKLSRPPELFQSATTLHHSFWRQNLIRILKTKLSDRILGSSGVLLGNPRILVMTQFSLLRSNPD